MQVGPRSSIPAPGPRMIPLVSGNLSVDWLMQRRTGGPAPAPGSNGEEIDALARLRVDAVEDYVAWGAVEPDEGAFDWSFHRENLARCRARKLRYVVYPWLHALPAWAAGRFTSWRCLEHDRECGWPSLFDPRLLDHYARFYGELKRA